MVKSIGPSTQNTRPKTRLRLYLLRFKIEFKHINRLTNNLANSLVKLGVDMNDPLVDGFFFFFLVRVCLYRTFTPPFIVLVFFIVSFLFNIRFFMDKIIKIKDTICAAWI